MPSPASRPELGVNLVAYAFNDFALAESSGAMEHLRRAIGADRAVLVPTFYTDPSDPGGLRVHPTKTASAMSLQLAVESAGRHGLRVALKPHVDIEAGGFRGELCPTGGDRARFFARYRELVIAPLAALAARHPGTVDAFVVGTELCALNDADAEWRATVAAVRSVAPRVRVGVATNYDALVPGDRRPHPLGWADALDFVGVDYFLGESDRDLPLFGLLQSIATVRRATGRPVLFTELGSRSDLRGGTKGQAKRIGRALKALDGQVEGVWLWNRFARHDESDAEGYTLGPQAVELLGGRR